MDNRTPLQKIQAHARENLYGGIPYGPLQEALDAFLGWAFDAGSAARRTLDLETARIEQGAGRAHYIVSTRPDMIDPTLEDGGSPTNYRTAEEAGEAVLNGSHGESGTRYVLKVELSVEAMYKRSYTLIRESEGE
jgi:hypothetical protein